VSTSGTPSLDFYFKKVFPRASERAEADSEGIDKEIIRGCLGGKEKSFCFIKSTDKVPVKQDVYGKHGRNAKNKEKSKKDT
jgi:hypothetical protein